MQAAFAEIAEAVPQDAFAARAASLAAMAVLRRGGPMPAVAIARSIDLAVQARPELVLPFRHATLFAQLYDLEHEGDLACVTQRRPGRSLQRLFSLTKQGTARLELEEARDSAFHGLCVLLNAADPAPPANDTALPTPSTEEPTP